MRQLQRTQSAIRNGVQKIAKKKKKKKLEKTTKKNKHEGVKLRIRG